MTIKQIATCALILVISIFVPILGFAVAGWCAGKLIAGDRS